MTNRIHSTAVLGPEVVLGSGNTIGPYAVLQGSIRLGDGNEIGPHMVFSNKVTVGDRNRFVGSTQIGSLGEMGSKGDVFVADGEVRIGSDNVIREFATVNSPVRKEVTRIGDRCYLMARTHVPHDATLGDNVVMATNSLVGGGAVVGDFAYIGLGSITHQWTDIGESAMVGLQAAVTKPVPPFCIVTGVPARVMKLNRVGAERRGIATEVLDEAERHLQEVLAGSYRSDNLIVRSILTFMAAHPEHMR